MKKLVWMALAAIATMAVTLNSCSGCTENTTSGTDSLTDTITDSVPGPIDSLDVPLPAEAAEVARIDSVDFSTVKPTGNPKEDAAKLVKSVGPFVLKQAQGKPLTAQEKKKYSDAENEFINFYHKKGQKLENAFAEAYDKASQAYIEKIMGL